MLNRFFFIIFIKPCHHDRFILGMALLAGIQCFINHKISAAFPSWLCFTGLGLDFPAHKVDQHFDGDLPVILMDMLPKEYHKTVMACVPVLLNGFPVKILR